MLLQILGRQPTEQKAGFFAGQRGELIVRLRGLRAYGTPTELGALLLDLADLELITMNAALPDQPDVDTMPAWWREAGWVRGELASEDDGTLLIERG